MDVSEVYKADFDEVQFRFIQLFCDVTELLVENVSLNELKLYLKKFPQMNPHVEEKHSVPDIMELVQDNSSYINCSCLKNIVRRFRVSLALEMITEYYEFVEMFCQYNLRKHTYVKSFLNVENPKPPLQSETIVFRLEWKPDQKTLCDIQGVLRKLFNDELSDHVHVVVVATGSVTVTCFASRQLMEELMQQAKTRHLLQDRELTYLSIGGTILKKTSFNEVPYNNSHACKTTNVNTMQIL